MSDDLISRNKLLEELNGFSMRITGSANAMALVVMDETKKSIVKMIEEQPKAFDLESVIEQIKEEEIRLLAEMELFEKAQGVSPELIFIKYNQALMELAKMKEILKSDTNITSEKSGGL